MFRWHFRARAVPRMLLRRMREDCGALVVANLQTRSAVPFLTAARRLGLPLVGYISSWDHTVGKGAISPYANRYVVQNDVMRDDLVRYHGIPAERVAVTGWPQTDVFHRLRPREAYEELLRGWGSSRRGRSSSSWGIRRRTRRMRSGSSSASSLGGAKPVREALLAPPPPAPARPPLARALRRGPRLEGAHVQEPSYTDLEALATLLQHGDCVVANAGTILLDSIVNDRPAVCVLYDEAAPPGERWASLNTVGEHYRRLMQSEAFYRAELRGSRRRDRAGARGPRELAAERARVAREVVGEVDGRAAERVVDAICARGARLSYAGLRSRWRSCFPSSAAGR